MWPADTITTERLMDELSQSMPHLPRKVGDGDGPKGKRDRTSFRRPGRQRGSRRCCPQGVLSLRFRLWDHFSSIGSREFTTADSSSRSISALDLPGRARRLLSLARTCAGLLPDSVDGRRPVEQLFDTFLHEVAHHLEYTEPSTFGSPGCGRVPGLMHSRLFWRILGELKWRWGELKAGRSF